MRAASDMAASDPVKRKGGEWPRFASLSERSSARFSSMASHSYNAPDQFPNAISVDVEDYFHTEAMSKVVSRSNWEQMPSRVRQNTERLFQLFADHNVRGTFFFLGWVAERYPELVRRANQLGHEIACHSYWHRPIYTLSPSEFREDLRRAKAAIEDAAGTRVAGYRAPSFSMTQGTEWASDILAENGFVYDSSVHPIAHDLYDNRRAQRFPYQVAGTSLVQIPISTLRFGSRNLPFAGGGYFRSLPYPCVRWAIKRFNRTERKPAVFYIHPWEIDPEQPRLPASGRSRLRQYNGLDTTIAKLSQMLKEFSFAPIGEVFG
jgi:polysaccharide deacetylase family protein (PEP-CTERM system associated)